MTTPDQREINDREWDDPDNWSGFWPLNIYFSERTRGSRCRGYSTPGYSVPVHAISATVLDRQSWRHLPLGGRVFWHGRLDAGRYATESGARNVTPHMWVNSRPLRLAIRRPTRPTSRLTSVIAKGESANSSKRRSTFTIRSPFEQSRESSRP